ncbi:MAG: shufflon system plasmid conjugative transfer pilus tip adhesin PilV, partial [Alphaproteobacteria bacterium]|nr:shufflon system plasmid conjugative transfer pilus tip adhesin PilV [Alphaproteobacteria bacterium]
MKQTSSGFSLLELLLSVALFAMILIGVAQMINRQGDDAKASVVALQLKTFGDAADEYIKDNYSTLLTATPGNTVRVVTFNDIGGYLPNNFTAQNAYGQSMCVLVKRSPAGSDNLIGLVVTEGGRAIDDVTLGQISATVGGSGGAIYGSNAAQVGGALGVWKFDVANF